MGSRCGFAIATLTDVGSALLRFSCVTETRCISNCSQLVLRDAGTALKRGRPGDLSELLSVGSAGLGSHGPSLDTAVSLQPAAVQLMYEKAGAQREPASSFSCVTMLNLARELWTSLLIGRAAI